AEPGPAAGPLPHQVRAGVEPGVQPRLPELALEPLSTLEVQVREGAPGVRAVRLGQARQRRDPAHDARAVHPQTRGPGSGRVRAAHRVAYPRAAAVSAAPTAACVGSTTGTPRASSSGLR